MPARPSGQFDVTCEKHASRFEVIADATVCSLVSNGVWSFRHRVVRARSVQELNELFGVSAALSIPGCLQLRSAQSVGNLDGMPGKEENLATMQLRLQAHLALGKRAVPPPLVIGPFGEAFGVRVGCRLARTEEAGERAIRSQRQQLTVLEEGLGLVEITQPPAGAESALGLPPLSQPLRLRTIVSHDRK